MLCGKRTLLPSASQPDKTMSRTDDLRFQLIAEVDAFITKHNVKSILASEVDNGNAPVVIEDYSTLQDDYQLDEFKVDEKGNVTLTCSSCYCNDEVDLVDLDVDVIEDIRDWLYDNEEESAEILANEN